MFRNSSQLASTPSKNQLLLNPLLVETGIVILLALVAVVINWKMIHDGINGMIDMQWHITWLQHFSKQLAEGIGYPRWLAGTNFGYGSPTFIFYPPLVYYLGALLKFSGLTIEQTVIVLFYLALFLSGLTFYIYGRNHWGVIPSVIGALAYMTAPYMGFLIYWVASIPSMFAQALIPLGWWLTDKALLQPKWRVGLALFWTVLALTHLPSLLLCAIAWLGYTLFFFLNRSWKDVVTTLLSAGIGLGIASFFLIPAILEQPLINIDEMQKVGGGFRVTNIGGMPLFPLSIDRGAPYVFLLQSLAIIALTIIALICCRKNAAIIHDTWRWLVFVLLLAFLMSSWSLPIWEASPTLQKVQSPLRLLQLFSFGGAVLYGVVTSGILKLRLQIRFVISLIIFVIFISNFAYSYKLARKFPTFNKPGRANIEHLEPVRKALDDPYTDKLIDVPQYIPLLPNGNPAPDPVIGQPQLSIIKGQASIEINHWGSYNRMFNVTAEELSTIRVRTYYYPAWHLYVNQKSRPIDISEDGTMKLTLEPGSYAVELRYQWTRAFTLGVALSVLSLITLSLFGIKLQKF